MSNIFDNVVDDSAWFRNEIRALDMREGTKLTSALEGITNDNLKSFCDDVLNNPNICYNHLMSYRELINYEALLLQLKYNESYTIHQLIDILSAYRL